MTSLFMTSLFMASLFMASDFPDLTVAVFSVELCLIIMYHIKIINLYFNRKKKKKNLKGNESESKINSSASSGSSQQ